MLRSPSSSSSDQQQPFLPSDPSHPHPFCPSSSSFWIFPPPLPHPSDHHPFLLFRFLSDHPSASPLAYSSFSSPNFPTTSASSSSVFRLRAMDKVQTRLRVRNQLGRALLGEFLGTFLLVLIIACVCAQAVLPKPALNQTIGVNLGVGLGIAFGVAVCAKVSGGHINPAVSLMFLSFKELKPLHFVLYSLVQLAGAFFGAAVAFLVYCDAISKFDGGTRQVYGTKGTAQIFASYGAPHLGVLNGFIDQVVATAVFCLAIAHITDKRNNYPSYLQPFLVGTSFVMVGTAFAYNAGYPCNPARDFGPRLFTLLAGYGWEVFSYNDYRWFWIPLIAPFIGALLGAWLYKFFIGIHYPADEPYEVTTITTTTIKQQPAEMQPLAPAKEHNEQA